MGPRAPSRPITAAWGVIVVWLAALGLLAWPLAKAAGLLLWLSLLAGLALMRTRPAGLEASG